MDELKKHQMETPDKNIKDALQCGLTVSLTPLPPLLQALSDNEREKLEKHLVRKLDLRLMPMLVLIYIMNYLDRCGHNAHKLSTSTDFSTAGMRLQPRNLLE